MNLIIVFFIIVYFILGYFVMNKIDNFIVDNIKPKEDYMVNKNNSEKDIKHKCILIFGDNQITDLIKCYCESKNYLYSITNDIWNIKKVYQYTSLFALSNSDLENLIVSSIGIEVYSIPYVISICNLPENLIIFNKLDIYEVIPQKDIHEEYVILRGLIENAAKVQF